MSAINFGRRVVIGTPVTPKALLPSLEGSSFCVSHADPRDLDRCIELVGENEILVLDNGAFSHWQQGRGAIDRVAFWNWANSAQACSPQAVAVIPDVIGGDERANLCELSYALRGDDSYAWFPERTMAIWHLDDSLEQLRTMCRLLNFVGMGSCAEYDVQRNASAYRERMREASGVIDAVELEHNRRPWVHLMRGLGAMAKYPELTRFDSADSTNVARNHARHKATHGDARARFLLDRTLGQVDARAAEAPVEAVTSSVSNFANPPVLRPAYS